MGELKPGWRRVKFGEVVRLGKERCEPVADGIGRYIGLEHMEPGDLRVRSWGEVSNGTTFTTRVRSGHVLFGKRRAYQRKVAVADFDAVCSGDIYVFESANPARLLPDLLPFLCQTDAFFDYAVGTSAGSLSPRTTWTSLAEYEFALPPIDEQRRAVALYQAQVSALEGLKEAQELADALARSLAHSLTQAGPMRPLGGMATFVTSGSRGWAEHYSESGAWFVRVTNLLPSSIRLDLTDLKFVRPPTGAEGTRTRVQPRDVLVAITGEYLGMIALAPPDIPEAYVNQHVAVVRIDPALGDPRFVAYALTSPAAQRQVWARNDGGTKPGMTLGQVKSLPVPDIPLSKQRRIADILDEAEGVRLALSRRRQSGAELYRASLNRLTRLES